MSFLDEASTNMGSKSGPSKAFLLKTFTLGCASAEKDKYAQRYHAKPPGSHETVEDLFVNEQIPLKMLELIGHISRSCMVQEGNFRVPGSAAAKRNIITAIKTNQPIDYNVGSKVLTAAVQGFTREVQGGLMSKDLELRFQHLSEVSNEDLDTKYRLTADIMSALQPVIRTYITLVFGLLFRYVQHKCWHKADAHAVALASGGCIFVHSYADTTSVSKIHTTIEWLIENFPVPTIWGRDNLQLFCDVTMSGLITKQVISHRFTLKDLMAEYEIHCSKTGSEVSAAVFMKLVANHIRRLNKKYNTNHSNFTHLERLKPTLSKQEIYRSADCMRPLKSSSVTREPLYHHGSVDQVFEVRRSIASRRESVRLRQALVHKQRRKFLESQHEKVIPEHQSDESKPAKITEVAQIHSPPTEYIPLPSQTRESTFQIRDEVIERTYTLETVLLPSTEAISGDSHLTTGNPNHQLTVDQLINAME